jgi:hypothetical protein
MKYLLLVPHGETTLILPLTADKWNIRQILPTSARAVLSQLMGAAFSEIIQYIYEVPFYYRNEVKNWKGK